MGHYEIALACLSSIAVIAGLVLSSPGGDSNLAGRPIWYAFWVLAVAFLFASLGSTAKGADAFGDSIFVGAWVAVAPVLISFYASRVRTVGLSFLAGMAGLSLVFAGHVVDAKPLATTCLASLVLLTTVGLRAIQPLGVFMLGGALVSSLGELRAPGGSLWLLGPALLTCIAIAFVLREGLFLRLSAVWSWLATFVVVAFLGWISIDRLGGSLALLAVFVVGVVAFPLLHFLLRDTLATNQRFALLVSGIILVGAAGWCFSLERGFGLAALLLGGTASALLIAEQQLIGAWGPVLALTLYRVFVETQRGGSVGMGLEAHYASIGMLLGLLFPALYQKLFDGVYLRAGMASMLLCLMTASAAAFLGQVGVVGMMLASGVGTILGSLYALTDEDTSFVRAYMLGGVVGAIGLLVLAVLPTSIARTTRISILIAAVLIAAISHLIIQAASKPKPTEVR